MTELLADIHLMRSSGFDPSTIEDSEARNALILRFLASPIGDHIRSIEGAETISASGGCLLGSAAIKDEISEYDPSAFLFPRGFLPIWSSFGGNVVVYSIDSARFYWAAHGSWYPDLDMITIPVPFETIPFTEEDVPRALIEMSDDPPAKFISDLVEGVYERRLSELD